VKDDMNICLIFPPVWGDIKEFAAIFPPHGLLCIAGYLERAGHNVSVIDCVIEQLDHSTLEQRIRDMSPDVIGVSILSSSRYSGFDCASIAKKVSKNILTVFGGVHATWYDREILERYPDIDVVVRGEGEATFLDLIESSNRRDVLGITYREDGHIVQNSDRPQIADIDTIPFPAFNLVPMEKYFKQAKKYEKFRRAPASMIMTSRGCLAKCIYCSTPAMWRGMRMHSPEYVVANIEYLQKNWGVKDLLVYDDTFPLSRKWFNDFYRMYKAKELDLTFRCLSRVTAVDQETLRKMKELGCYFIHYGIESGSDKILKRIKKGINTTQIKKAFDETNKAGIMPGMFLMIGFPDEELSDIYETLKVARTLKAYDLGFAITMVFPGTELWREESGDTDLWFAEDHKDERGRFASPIIPIYRNKNISRDEINEYALHIVHQFNIHNFFRRLYFNAMTRQTYLLSYLVNSVLELSTDAYTIRKYPFEGFERRKYRISDWFLKKLYETLLFIKKCKDTIKARLVI
jgi:radical SAM superfamily enzyme YgiQ (UPF0313 family)